MTGLSLTPIAPRIQRLIRLLGSDRDGEVLATVAALRRTLNSVGLDLHALADAIVPQLPGPTRSSGKPPFGDWRISVRWLLEREELLTAWELNFVRSLGRFREISPKQRSCLGAISEKFKGGDR